MGLHVSTQWLVHPTVRPLTSEECHAMFAQYVRDIADLKMPWLYPLLEAANAEIYTQPGIFFVAVPTSPGDWHSVPELGNLITHVPWVTEDSKPQ